MSSSTSSNNQTKETTTMTTTMWASLGMNPETGTCVRHPSVRIRLGTLSQCHYTTCRLCAYDLQAKEAHLKDPPESHDDAAQHVLPTDHEQDEDEDEPGDEDILDDEDEDECELNHQNDGNDSHSQIVMTRIQQAIMRISQLHALTLLEKDELIVSLQRQVAAQDERILKLQATVDQKQKTITKELKVIKAIAKQRAQIRRGSMETSTTSSTPETPSEQPPRLPGRKPSQPWNSVMSSTTESGITLSAHSASSHSTGSGSGSASSVPPLPQLPPPPSTATAGFYMKRPGPSLNNGANSTPPILPQRMASVDTLTSSYNQYVDDTYRQDSLDTEQAKVYASSNFSSVTSGDELTSSLLTNNSRSFAASEYSKHISSAVTIDTFTELQKPPQRKLSARPDPSDDEPKPDTVEPLSRGHSYSTGFTTKTGEVSINDKGDDQSIEDPFIADSNHDPSHPQSPPPPPPPPPLPSQQPPPHQAQEISFVPTKQEIAFLPTSLSPKLTPTSLRTSKSIPIPIRQTLPLDGPFDGHATAPVGSFQQEIEFDATATFPHHQEQSKSNHLRTSIAQVRFDEPLLLEASQALHTTALLIPTPSSVKIRKSLTKLPEQQKQQQHEYGRSVSTPSIGSRPRTLSKEIEFSVTPEPIKAKSVLERHLEGGSKSTGRNLGESMHNKTEEQILEEKVYGKSAVATAEDEEKDDYDDFDAGSIDLPFTNKMGYLEYSKDMNSSPVSCLTTLSSGIRDNSQITEEQEETGPGKALHSGGLTKRLPLEDEFDSDDDDDDGPGNGQANDEEDKPRSNQDLSTGGKSTSNTTTSSSGNRSNNSNSNTNTNSESNLDKTSSEGNNSSSYNSNKDPNIPAWNGRGSTLIMSDSMPTYEASQRSLRTDSRKPTSKLASPFAHSGKRHTKHVVRVDNDTVQDKYGDEGKYTGTIAVDSRLPHGYGQMRYDNERQYDGEWKGGRWHGHGRWMNPNGDCYEGTFDYDARHGRGKYTWKNGNVYRGEFDHDKRQGKGVFHFANGNEYVGDFINGVFDGQGRYKFDGGSYEGEWKNGRYHGRGILIFTDGSSYNGAFLDGVAHGQGEEKGSDGTIRKGIWEHGKPQAFE